ncbi:hypothetical protein CHELA20_52401 [Hyphomicrobiales bacterium]|nr:hypothetical protein CHELA41_22520 [Hyphomicrobiales bacterium]CAH1681782.1 hypothetical protein CHELA20_52401 [Hyphomicrobiales bacterium]
MLADQLRSALRGQVIPGWRRLSPEWMDAADAGLATSISMDRGTAATDPSPQGEGSTRRG